MFFNETATTEIYTLSLHDALPIGVCNGLEYIWTHGGNVFDPNDPSKVIIDSPESASGLETWHSMIEDGVSRSEEHTSELQSRQYLVCRLLLEKKKYLVYSLRLHIS